MLCSFTFCTQRQKSYTLELLVLGIIQILLCATLWCGVYELVLMFVYSWLINALWLRLSFLLGVPSYTRWFYLVCLYIVNVFLLFRQTALRPFTPFLPSTSGWSLQEQHSTVSGNGNTVERFCLSPSCRHPPSPLPPPSAFLLFSLFYLRSSLSFLLPPLSSVCPSSLALLRRV